MRIWRVPPRHPFDRRLQVEEAMFLNQCGKLRAEAAGPRRLMDDDAAPRFLNRAGDRAKAQRDERAKADNFGIDTGALGRGQSDMAHGDRKTAVGGKRVSERVDTGGGGTMKKKRRIDKNSPKKT